ncbi:hypothetical protein BDA96_01G150900 [Sorghum bicolor]|nr:hypothetical protein BDA96_01G150900 [Sorghum bicolor]
MPCRARSPRAATTLPLRHLTPCCSRDPSIGLADACVGHSIVTGARRLKVAAGDAGVPGPCAPARCLTDCAGTGRRTPQNHQLPLHTGREFSKEGRGVSERREEHCGATCNHQLGPRQKQISASKHILSTQRLCCEHRKKANSSKRQTLLASMCMNIMYIPNMIRTYSKLTKGARDSA